MKNAYGKEAARHARVLLSQGWTNDEIREVEVCKQIPADALRRWRFRMKEKNETHETQGETTGNAVSANDTTEHQNPATTTGNAVSPVSETPQNVSAFRQFRREFSGTFHPADLIFYGCVSIGCVGVSEALPGIGVPVSIVWVSVAAMLLHRLKMYARWGDVIIGALVELLAGGTAHFIWANGAIWKNIERLPFEVYVEKYKNGAGEWVAFYAGKDVEQPGKVAVCIAISLCVFAAYAAYVSVEANRNKG